MIDLKPYLPRELPPPLEALSVLALDLRWSWNHASDELWRLIDPDLWEATGNPWLIMQSVSRERLDTLAADEAFMSEFQRIIRDRAENLAEITWFDRVERGEELGLVAYFSMEFGLSESLPIYSGGLGILAGDVLKTASDLGVPMVGIGLLYQQGYFRQAINGNGDQLAYFPFNDPAMLPILPLRDASGSWLRIQVELPGRSLQLRCWDVQIGRTHLYLLDANHPVNNPRDRGITGELYGGDNETRLAQEIILGIGGWRLLEALDLPVRVCHLNEGHAALAVLERAARAMPQLDVDFVTALRATRAGNIFTTHTPVPAAFDRFDPLLARQYLEPYATQWGIDLDTLVDLGRGVSDGADAPLNMAYLALRASGAAFGVSRLHGSVSRALFAPLFPRWPLDEVPIGHITNGVHTPTWDSQAADALWTRACGKARWSGEIKPVAEKVAVLDDETLWNFRAQQRHGLIGALRARIALQRANRGEPQDRVAASVNLLDPNTLTLGFARRFTGYKRPNLLLEQPERLARLLSDPHRPVQLVLAGKAHPKDGPGQAMIRQWFDFIRQNEALSRHVIFIEDYDMALAAELVQGVDVWINTPRRPWEASGTSGMKVLVNGGLNLSELDGWWAEAYTPDMGWALGDRAEHDSDPVWDRHEAEMLYQVLEESVIPDFYARDARGIPQRWVARVRESMARLTPVYSTNRMLREYVETYYLPAARAVGNRLASGGEAARTLQDWARRIDAHWPAVRIGGANLGVEAGVLHVDVQVFLDDLQVDDVCVQLFANSVEADTAPERHVLVRSEPLPGAVNGFHYTAHVATNRSVADYTVRIVPNHPLASIPLDSRHILWDHE